MDDVKRVVPETGGGYIDLREATPEPWAKNKGPVRKITRVSAESLLIDAVDTPPYVVANGPYKGRIYKRVGKNLVRCADTT